MPDDREEALEFAKYPMRARIAAWVVFVLAAYGAGNLLRKLADALGDDGALSGAKKRGRCLSGGTTYNFMPLHGAYWPEIGFIAFLRL